LETHVPVVVERARYGVLDDPARTRDVREKVQARIDAGESSFAVRLMAEGDDPAPGALKTLAVDYVIGGKHFSVKGQDPATIHLTAQALSVTVESARYGVLDDPKRTRDVRQKLQALFDAGESKFVVARMAEGDDPAFLVVKTLIAECQVDGKRMTLKGTDPELIDLRPKLLQPFARPLELHQATTKGLRAEVCQPGHYEVTSLRGARAEFSVAATPPALEITGPWKVEFTPGMGAPAETVLDRLISWSEHAEPGIKYFSGVATYTKTVHIPREMLANNRRLYLDLGKVAVIAEVRWNGKAPIILWKPPFRADVTRNAKVGDNQLEVRVVNLWPNRMIGDEQLPEDSDRNPDGTLKRWPPWLQEGKPSPTGRYTFTTWRLWKKNDALLESGLLGPVRLQTAELRSLRLPQ
jgi:hypothetical protein